MSICCSCPAEKQLLERTCVLKNCSRAGGGTQWKGACLASWRPWIRHPARPKKTNKQKKTKTKVGQLRLCCSKGHKLRFTDNLEGKRKDAYLPIKYMQLNFSGCLISMGRKNPSLSHYLFRQIKELFHLASNTVGVISDHKQYW